jgi:hypothetical protein
VVSIDLAPEGSRLIAGDREGKIHIWDLKQLTLQDPGSATTSNIIATVPYEVKHVGWVPGSELVVAEGLDSTLRLLDIPSGRQLREFQRHSPPPLFAISPDGAILASVGSGRIRLWEIDSGREIRTLPAHEHYTQALAFSPDAKLLASGGDRGRVILRDVASGQERLRIEHPEKSLAQIAFSPDGRMLATIGYGRGTDAPLRLWDTANGERIDELRSPGADIKTFAFSPDGSILVGAGSDHKLHIWELTSSQKLTSISLGRGAPQQLAIGAGGILYFAAGKEVRLWNFVALVNSVQDASSQLALVEVPADPATGVTHVTNAGQLLGSLGSGRTLQLAPGIYNLSQVRWGDLPHVTWRPVFDGEEILIHDLADITLRGDSKNQVVIVVDPRAAGVLSFEKVDGLRLENIELRHTGGNKECTGGVLSLRDVNRVTVDRCQLLGSGREGLNMRGVKNFRFGNSEIRDCVNSVMTVIDSHNLTFENSRFVDNGARFAPAFSFDGSSAVSFNRVIITGNTGSPGLFSFHSTKEIKIADSEILANKADQLADTTDAVRVTNTRIAGNDFPAPLPAGSRFAGLEIAIGRAFRKGGKISIDNSLFSGFDARRIKLDDRVDVVDERGLIVRATVTEVSGDGVLLATEPDSYSSQWVATKPEGSIDVFVLHPSLPERNRSRSTAPINLNSMETALPSEVKNRLETSRAQAPQYMGGRAAFGIDWVGDADGDGTLDLMTLSLACRPGSDYTCHTVLVFDDGVWHEAKRIGHP